MDPRRAIPSVDRLLASEPFAAVLAELPRDIVVAALQAETRRVREVAATMDAQTLADPHWYALRVRRAAETVAGGSLHPVINATGVILHTNLGRAPLADAALVAIHAAASGYADLEYDLETGARGSRYVHCRDLLVHLTGAEDALVINNNAAALVLALNTFAYGRDAVISRGELVEIGGAFRVPEIMERSGARLREVGATNRTHAADYRAALSEHTGAILKVHPSNFTMDGFTAEVEVHELARIADAAGITLIHDIGSGLLLPPERLGLPPEPTPQDSLRAGAALVTMSGDKLLGGPQCGIVLGRAELLGRMRRNPLCRALRVDKLTLAALSATLRLYLDPEAALRDVPVLRMITLPEAVIASRAEALARALLDDGVPATVAPGSSAIGGGAAPAAALPTRLLRIRPAVGVIEAERRLRALRPPVIVRTLDDALLVDLRTVAPADDAVILAALRAACADPAL
jgi:L-seryl-tRNA(Ser) seleniumtransferase